MISRRLLKKIIRNGGGNLINGEITTYQSGYSVSLIDGKIFDLKHVDESDIINYINLYFKDSCGLWVDNNKLYIDYSVNITSLDLALEIGKRFNQLAIYDCKNNCSIYLDKE